MIFVSCSTEPDDVQWLRDGDALTSGTAEQICHERRSLKNIDLPGDKTIGCSPKDSIKDLVDIYAKL